MLIAIYNLVITLYHNFNPINIQNFLILCIEQ